MQTSTAKPLTIAMIGTGTMGSPIGLNMIAAGHRVVAYDQFAEATSDLAAAGAAIAGSVAEAAAGADAVVLSLPGPTEVQQAVAGAQGVLSASPLPAVVIDVSTNSPQMVASLRSACAQAGTAFVDAPVSGGVAKAREGTLAVLVGASDEEFEAAAPVLAAFGSGGESVVHVGPSGSGTIAKIVNNQLFLAGATIVQEAYALAAALGMDPADAHEVISISSAAPYSKLAPLLLSRRFDDVIFRLDIAAKDIALARSAATEAGLDLPVTAAAADLYRDAVDSGFGSEVFHATLKQLELKAGDLQVPPLKRRPRS
ncbi:MAG: NAD(P)-dependent oxidoreductase [Acidimicrobiales bacterium]